MVDDEARNTKGNATLN